MNTKLTLTIEQSIIEKAKKYAKGKGRSLSDIVENYLKVIIKEENIRLTDSIPITSSLKGSFKAPKDFEDSLQNFAALKNGEIDVILTRNVKDFSKSEICVLTPESYIKSIIADR